MSDTSNNSFPNLPEQDENISDSFYQAVVGKNTISVSAAPSGPEVRAKEVHYINKDQLLQMIKDNTGTSASTLGAAVYSVGVSLAANALKARLPQAVAGVLIAAATVITVGQLIQQIAAYTPANQLQQILLQLVENYKQFTRIKVTVTTWQEFHVGPTLGYWTYYTTTSYEAV